MIPVHLITKTNASGLLNLSQSSVCMYPGASRGTWFWGGGGESSTSPQVCEQ